MKCINCGFRIISTESVKGYSKNSMFECIECGHVWFEDIKGEVLK
jgi:uncharacterized Zn finger protein